MFAELKRPYYGWIIVATSFLITTFVYGLQYTLGVFLRPLQEDFEWTRAMAMFLAAMPIPFLRQPKIAAQAKSEIRSTESIGIT